MQHHLVEQLQKIGAVQFQKDQPFIWTSGIKSPIYCDLRLTISYPEIRKQITDAFVSYITQMDVKPDVIVGCATAGIPHAALLAERLQLPLVYVRSSPKKHGTGKQIEGVLKKGQKAIVVEDLISTGKSSLQAAKLIQEVEVEVLCVCAIFTYGLQRTYATFEEEYMPLHSLINLDEMLDFLQCNNKMDSDKITKIINWRNQFD
ncbi:orotate phosphoribosyltransferase [Virgibacillus soli]|uniref:Orotate phosphoribosyltransferase n=1 Tax=Paracerasibacillus soli TaxID=480284 RepID=A0ABU5CP45_9BACI|nr:orotate phosphoribosyltransferase [Virgibacillus soli]MDY0408121.1 orotate phosphoribosyltransferase [Virgibacillus soli]